MTLEALAASHDIISLGVMADEVRRQRHGVRTTFLRVATVAADPGAPAAVPAAAGEIRIAGAPASVRAAVDRAAEVVGAAHGAPVSAFSLADLEQLSSRDGMPLRTLLESLRAAGVESIAEAPIDALADARGSLEAADSAGLALARLTVDKLPSADPMPLLQAAAELQRAVGVVRAFAPLPRRMNAAAPTTGFDDVKRVALARVVVDNVPAIQVDWTLYGPKLAQVAITVGADDLDAVSADDDVSQGHRRSPLEDVRRNIRAAHYEPVERNGRWDLLSR